MMLAKELPLYRMVHATHAGSAIHGRRPGAERIIQLLTITRSVWLTAD